MITMNWFAVIIHLASMATGLLALKMGAHDIALGIFMGGFGLAPGARAPQRKTNGDGAFYATPVPVTKPKGP